MVSLSFMGNFLRFAFFLLIYNNALAVIEDATIIKDNSLTYSHQFPQKQTNNLKTETQIMTKDDIQKLDAQYNNNKIIQPQQNNTNVQQGQQVNISSQQQSLSMQPNNTSGQVQQNQNLLQQEGNTVNQIPQNQNLIQAPVKHIELSDYKIPKFLENSETVQKPKSNFNIIGYDKTFTQSQEKEVQEERISIEQEKKAIKGKYAIIDIPKKEIKIETMTKKQIDAKNENLPSPYLKSNEQIGWKRQIIPPNISQKIYTETNRHLVPVIFQNDIDGMSFNYIKNPNDSAILRSLLEKMSTIDIQDENGNTLLMHTVYYSNHDSMIMLLQRGANTKIHNDFGFSPLHLAASVGDKIAVKILVQYGAEINAPDMSGSTPIMYAAISGNLPTVKYLLRNHANLDLLNNKGYNIFDFAEKSDNQNIIKYINKYLDR